MPGDILDAIETDADAIREATQAARDAELEDSPAHDDGPDQNNHFEFDYGGVTTNHPKVTMYIERYDGPPTGVQLMVWADDEWLRPDHIDSTPDDIHDADDHLATIATRFRDVMADALDVEQPPQFTFHSNAPPSAIYSTTFYL